MHHQVAKIMELKIIIREDGLISLMKAGLWVGPNEGSNK